MTDPMTALSIAAATVQFVDFSLKIISLCREIQKSTNNATEANAEIESSVEKLQEYQKRLKPFGPGQGLSQKDIDTIEAARQDCNDVASKILKVLQDLKPKKQRWYGESAAAWRAHRVQDKIQSLERRLEGRNARFREALTDVTRERVLHMLEEQSDLMRNTLLPELKQIRIDNTAARSTTQDKLNKQDDLIRNTLVTGIKQMHIDSTAAHSTTQKKLEEARLTADQKDFLSKLSFEKMSERHERIEPPSTGTYEWIFTDESSQPGDSFNQRELRGKFMRWLISDQKVFWISGKAGSGKSSLMSFIESHRRFSEGLKQWSQGRRLTVLNFFFWRAGVHLQKSVPGLLRSLLHQLLTRKPSAIGEICMNDSTLKYSDWTEERLFRVLNEVLNLYQRANECVFFLLDGLDEFEGSYFELIQGILTVELRPNTKICLSSRPVGTLQDCLGSYPSIRLEDLNFRDIEEFVTRKMTNVGYPYTNHKTQIPYRAQGIFLWAALVTKELVRGYKEEHYTEATLQKILAELPQGLTPLFNRFFSDVKQHSRDFLLLVFQLLKSASNWGVNIAVLTAYLHHNHVTTIHEFLRQSHKVQQQINFQSKGLLEIVRNPVNNIPSRGWAMKDPSTHQPCQTALDDDVLRTWEMVAWSNVDWLHRSAYDYIFNSSEAELPTWIREVNIAQNVFDGCMWLSRYGLLMYEIDTDDLLIQSDVPMLTNLITAQVCENPSCVYQTLDNFCELLDSSLGEGSWLDQDIQAHPRCTEGMPYSVIASSSDAFWSILAHKGYHDYILSRFNLVRRGRFAQVVCFHLLCEFGTTPSLMRLVLDVLIEKTRNLMCNATLQTKEASEYRYSESGRFEAISWISHGMYFETQLIDRMSYTTFRRTIGRLKALERSFSDTHLEQVSPDTSTVSLIEDLIVLLDHWQLFDGSVVSYADSSPLKIHLCISHTLRHINTDIGTTNGIPIRLLGMPKHTHEYVQGKRIGAVPTCVFHTSPVTNSALSRFLMHGLRNLDIVPIFKGSLANFLGRRESLIEEIREDAAHQLDALQQRYLLVIVNICFFCHWRIEDWEKFPSHEW